MIATKVRRATGYAVDFQLQKLATLRLQNLTRVEGRTVTIDDDCTVGCLYEGNPCVPEQPSRGAKDQLHLAIRLAVVDLIASEVRLAVIFDDSFVSWDAPRRDHLRTLLNREAETEPILDLFHS